MIMNEKHRRVQGKLDLYMPNGDMMESFKLISPNKSSLTLPRSKVIAIRQVQRETDNKWVLSFELKDPTYQRPFDKFCRNIIDLLADETDPTRGPDDILLEFAEWKHLFSLEHLDADDIQGIIGELLFLRDYLIPKYGEIKAIESWTRTSFGKQDFILDDTWYEVKAMKTGAGRIVINSVEQLDNIKSGHLAIVELQASTNVSSKSFNLRTLYSSIRNCLINPYSIKMFDDAMNRYIMYDDRYDELVFEELDIESYSVVQTFPRIKRKDIPQGVRIPSYEILIMDIEPFKEEIQWKMS